MKNTLTICVMIAIMFAACKKISVDFTYSPSEPKAGETVKFTNNSSAGEDWTWTFGDNTTSLLKSPSKTYKKPGTYEVKLMVDSSKYQTCVKYITVYDTIPTFVCSTDSILHYQDVVFTANIYNPYKYPQTFEWKLPENCVLQSANATSSTVTVYFTHPGEYDIELAITQNDKNFHIPKQFSVHQTQAPAIVMQTTDESLVRQRIINDRIEHIGPATQEDAELVAATNDTMVVFNEITFYASQMSSYPQLTGFANLSISRIQIDAIAQKWYITTTEGLFVANLDSKYLVLIDANATGAIHLDAQRNRIYWASTEGMKAMPLIKSKNNQFTTEPKLYNSLNNIELITVNNTLQ